LISPHTFDMPKHSKHTTKEERKRAAKRGPYGKQYSKPELLLAVSAVQKHQMSQRAASNAFHVPLTSLQNYLHRHSAVQEEEVASAPPSHVQLPSCPSLPALPLLVRVVTSIDPHGRLSISFEAEHQSRVGTQISIDSSMPLLLAPPPGPSPLMTHEEEKAFAQWLICCSDLHLPTPKCIASEKARMILERRGAQFSTASRLPSREWWDGFYRRWPAVGPRKPQPITKGKALLTKEHVDAFFRDLQTLSSSIPPQVSKGATWVRVACAKTG
jgi:hypothetical protein